ncbi:MAG: DUF4824 family protein [Ilumatobacteraceae bacterium]
MARDCGRQGNAIRRVRVQCRRPRRGNHRFVEVDLKGAERWKEIRPIRHDSSRLFAVDTSLDFPGLRCRWNSRQTYQVVAGEIFQQPVLNDDEILGLYLRACRRGRRKRLSSSGSRTGASEGMRAYRCDRRDDATGGIEGGACPADRDAVGKSAVARSRINNVSAT